MTFPVDVFAGCLAFLLPQLALLFFDPGQLRNGEDAHRVEAHALRGGNAYPSGRRMDAQMDVLDFLSNNVHANVTELDPRAASVFFLSFDNQENPLHLLSVVGQKREKCGLDDILLRLIAPKSVGPNAPHRLVDLKSQRFILIQIVVEGALARRIQFLRRVGRLACLHLLRKVGNPLQESLVIDPQSLQIRDYLVQ